VRRPDEKPSTAQVTKKEVPVHVKAASQRRAEKLQQRTMRGHARSTPPRKKETKRDG